MRGAEALRFPGVNLGKLSPGFSCQGRGWLLDLTLRRLRGKAGPEATQSESVSRVLLPEPR